MNEKNKYFNILIFSGVEGECSRFKVSRSSLKAACGVISALLIITLVSSVVFVNKYMNAMNELKEMPVLKEKASSQTKELDLFVKKVKTLEKSMTDLEKFEEKLKNIFTIETIKANSETEKNAGDLESAKPETDTEYKIKNASHSVGKGSMITTEIKNYITNLSLRTTSRLSSFQQLTESLSQKKEKLLSIPSIWPVRGWTTSGFGYRKSPFTGLREVHDGLDIASPRGSPIVAPADGIVLRASFDRGYGKIIEIDHGFGILTKYGHNSKHFVKEGEKVKRGQLIATVGNTGTTTGSHLHYEVLLDGVPVDPLKFLIHD